ncbi:hypothetical protein HY030_02465 [Candidatus Gottesmanbacteria bacterium]|nr:hypothetical protein [Candidatus Gottesmanbacteria bacterium]
MISILTKLFLAKVLGLTLLLITNTRVYAIPTALGDIPTEPGPLAGWFLSSAIGIAGGLAFLLILYGGFLFMTSAGDPNKLQEATDVILSAISGLLMILFSMFLLKLIGVSILGL